MSEKQKKTPANRKGWVKAIRMIVKWTWIPATCAAALLIGLTVGYVYIGKQSMDEVFEFATWRHLFDLVFANT